MPRYKRLVCALAATAVFAIPNVSVAQAPGLETLVLPLPKGYALTPGSINGPLTAEEFATFAPDAVDEYRQMEKDKLIEGYGRVMQNTSTETVIVVFLFRGRSTAFATDLYKGFREGAEGNKTFTATIPDAIGFVDSAEGATMFGVAFQRKRYAAIVGVLGEGANEKTANAFASQQRGRLPDDAGDAAFDAGYKFGATIRDWLWAIGLGVLTLIVFVIVLVMRARRRRLAAQPVLPGVTGAPATPPPYERPSGGVCRNGHPIPQGQFFCTTCGAPAAAEEQQQPT